MTLTAPIIPLSLRDRAPDLALRLGAILLGLAGVVARRFLKDPRLLGLIGPLWRRLTRIAGRFAGAVARPEATRAARPAKTLAARPGREPGATTLANRLPGGRGWLVRELGWEAAGYGSQLAHLLAEPEMQALIAAVPGVGRVLRPICRMLGYDLAAVPAMIAPVKAQPAPPPPVWRPADAVSEVGIRSEKAGFATLG